MRFWSFEFERCLWTVTVAIIGLLFLLKIRWCFLPLEPIEFDASLLLREGLPISRILIGSHRFGLLLRGRSCWSCPKAVEVKRSWLLLGSSRHRSRKRRWRLVIVGCILENLIFRRCNSVPPRWRSCRNMPWLRLCTSSAGPSSLTRSTSGNGCHRGGPLAKRRCLIRRRITVSSTEIES